MLLARVFPFHGSEPSLDIFRLVGLALEAPAVPLLLHSASPDVNSWQSQFPGKDTIGKDSARLSPSDCGEVEG